jgi:hypothetical protein
VRPLEPGWNETLGEVVGETVGEPLAVSQPWPKLNHGGSRLIRFFCALHPTMREDWAKSWARHMRPGGQLITLIFPVEAEPRDGGPPWYVHPDMYTAVLTANGIASHLPSSH